METPEFQKTSQISLKGCHTFMRRNFRHIDLEIYCKSALEPPFFGIYLTQSHEQLSKRNGNAV